MKLNNHQRKSNGGNYSNYLRKSNGNNYSYYSNYSESDSNYAVDENYNNKYIRNVSLEKNINKNRIKKMDNINESNGNYSNEPIRYYQREINSIKNSYMNQTYGQPQTSQKIEYPTKRKNNLVFSSNKIPFRKINYSNINQSIDLLLSAQK